MRFVFIFLFGLLAACDRTLLTTVRPPRLPMADLEARPEPPAAIAVRYVVIRYAGADDAPETITRTKDEAQTRAAMVSGFARQSGQSFREVQSNYSEGSNAQIVLRRDDGRLPEEVTEVAFGLGVGERSTPVETPEGFYIVAREADPQLGPTTVYVSHVLVSFQGARNTVEGVTRSREQAQEIIAQVRAQAEAEPARFDEIAAEFSDEPGAAESGGDLGAVTRGQMVAPFERAAFLLEVGQVSAVVETAFGYHVIYRYR